MSLSTKAITFNCLHLNTDDVAGTPYRSTTIPVVEGHNETATVSSCSKHSKAVMWIAGLLCLSAILFALIWWDTWGKVKLVENDPILSESVSLPSDQPFGLSLDIILHHEVTTTYDGMIDLCKNGGMVPLETLVRQYTVDLPAQIGVEIESAGVFAKTSGEVLMWTGAKFDVLSDRPYVHLLPGNQRRTSLDILGWCSDSKDYKAVIDKQRAKLSQLPLKYRNWNLKPKDSLFVTLRYPNDLDKKACLHLYDGDIGKLDSNTNSRLVPACKSKSTLAITGGPLQSSYVPFMTRDSVTFANAAQSCKSLGRGYALAGPESADLMVLKQTSHAIISLKAPGV